jgi:hypothetical protein
MREEFLEKSTSLLSYKLLLVMARSVFDVRSLLASSRQNLEKTSDEAIPLHQLTNEGFSNITKSLHHELRARRLLRGCSNAQLSLFSIHSTQRLAMTKGDDKLYSLQREICWL